MSLTAPATANIVQGVPPPPEDEGADMELTGVAPSNIQHSDVTPPQTPSNFWREKEDWQRFADQQREIPVKRQGRRQESPAGKFQMETESLSMATQQLIAEIDETALQIGAEADSRRQEQAGRVRQLVEESQDVQYRLLNSIDKLTRLGEQQQKELASLPASAPSDQVTILTARISHTQSERLLMVYALEDVQKLLQKIADKLT